jgi:hypothetical protein
VAAVAYLTGLDDLLWNRDIDRDRVEEVGKRALIHQGVSASDVSCPSGLDRRRGAAVVCTYTDLGSKIAGTLLVPEDPPPPAEGRFEVRISGFEVRGVGTNRTRTPQFEARVIEPARRPTSGRAACPPRLPPELVRRLKDLGEIGREVLERCRTPR